MQFGSLHLVRGQDLGAERRPSIQEGPVRSYRSSPRRGSERFRRCWCQRRQGDVRDGGTLAVRSSKLDRTSSDQQRCCKGPGRQWVDCPCSVLLARVPVAVAVAVAADGSASRLLVVRVADEVASPALAQARQEALRRQRNLRRRLG